MANELVNKLYANRHLEYDEYLSLLTCWQDINKNYLFELARKNAKSIYGNKIYLRGLVEISNICKNDCFYCGIRKSNTKAARYRLSKEQILACCRKGYDLGLRTFVLQGGEDPRQTDEFFCSLITEIKKRWPDAALTLSLGEKSFESYSAFFKAGANRYLLRHETANAKHYAKIHPENMTFENRRKCLENLKSIGFQTGAGFMVGSPCQTPESLAEDLLFLQKLKPHMVGIGPFIPHKDTPFANENAGSAELTLILLALVRLMLPQALLPATTALATAEANGYEQGILAGANVIMPNLTPPLERSQYQIYEGKTPTAVEELNVLQKQIAAIGYNIVTSRGDHASFSI